MGRGTTSLKVLTCKVIMISCIKISGYHNQSGKYQQKNCLQMLARIWKKGEPSFILGENAKIHNSLKENQCGKFL